MKNSIVLTLGIFVLLGCSNKITVATTQSECQLLKDELSSLKFEHRMEQGGTIANTLTLRNQYSKTDAHLDQKVKVLEMKVQECERRSK